MSSNSAILIIGACKNIPKSVAVALASFLTTNTSLANAAPVLSAAPVEIILQSSPSQLVSNLASIDLGNMNQNKKGLLANQVIFLKNEKIKN
jgi:hypothetical protein